MGNYASVADVSAELTSAIAAQLTTDSGTTPDSTVINEQIDRAEKAVDAYLSKRIAVPVNVSTYPDMADWVKRLTLAVVVWQLYNRRRTSVPTVNAAYNAVIDELKAFVEGDVTTPAGEVVPSTLSEGASGNWGSETLVSGRDNQVGL